jgi:hypothetical protein
MTKTDDYPRWHPKWQPTWQTKWQPPLKLKWQRKKTTQIISQMTTQKKSNYNLDGSPHAKPDDNLDTHARWQPRYQHRWPEKSSNDNLVLGCHLVSRQCCHLSCSLRFYMGYHLGVIIWHCHLGYLLGCHLDWHLGCHLDCHLVVIWRCLLRWQTAHYNLFKNFIASLFMEVGVNLCQIHLNVIIFPIILKTLCVGGNLCLFYITLPSNLLSSSLIPNFDRHYRILKKIVAL